MSKRQKLERGYEQEYKWTSVTVEVESLYANTFAVNKVTFPGIGVRSDDGEHTSMMEVSKIWYYCCPYSEVVSGLNVGLNTQCIFTRSPHLYATPAVQYRQMIASPDTYFFRNDEYVAMGTSGYWTIQFDRKWPEQYDLSDPAGKGLLITNPVAYLMYRQNLDTSARAFEVVLKLQHRIVWVDSFYYMKVNAEAQTGTSS